MYARKSLRYYIILLLTLYSYTPSITPYPSFAVKRQ